MRDYDKEQRARWRARVLRNARIVREGATCCRVGCGRRVPRGRVYCEEHRRRP